jgi:hypothetical protein
MFFLICISLGTHILIYLFILIVRLGNFQVRVCFRIVLCNTSDDKIIRLMEDEMGRTCSSHTKVRTVYKISVGESEGKPPLRTCVQYPQLTSIWSIDLIH